ncbi:MAG: GPR endopeptidase [Bacilli bacterium]|nr:GPR endopeptidase [Bacilli bacterium]
MGHKIDLSKYQIRTDLAIENIDSDLSKKNSKDYEGIAVTDLFVDKELSLKINKKVGHYITIDFKDVTDFESRQKVTSVFSKQLKEMIKKLGIDGGLILIIGLGNDKSTPDALGPLALEHVVITNHLYELGELAPGFKRTSLFLPGVMGQTGLETSDLIKSIVDKIKPSLVLTVDALASSSLDRVNKTIQMTDAGINPGSGVGNKRKEISKETLDVPVIAVGVPTVVDAVTIVSDTIKYMHRHFSYTKKNVNNPLNKLIPFSKVNVLNEDVEIDDSIKESLLGLVGSLSEDEVKQLIFEILTPIGYNLIVTPKEIDFVVDKLGEVLGNGINQALHDNI